jgi:hypothetical protein
VAGVPRSILASRPGHQHVVPKHRVEQAAAEIHRRPGVRLDDPAHSGPTRVELEQQVFQLGCAER